MIIFSRVVEMLQNVQGGVLCEASKTLHFPANTGYEVFVSLVLFYLFSTWFWLSGVSLALSPDETAAELSKYCQIFYE